VERIPHLLSPALPLFADFFNSRMFSIYSLESEEWIALPTPLAPSIGWKLKSGRASASCAASGMAEKTV
jgi:hypothetical protein